MTHWLDGKPETAMIQRPYTLLTNNPSYIRLTCKMFNIRYPARPEQVITITTLPGFRQGTLIGYKDYSGIWTLASQIETLVIDVPHYLGRAWGNAGTVVYLNFECNDSAPVTHRTIMQTCTIEEIA